MAGDEVWERVLEAADLDASRDFYIRMDGLSKVSCGVRISLQISPADSIAVRVD